MAGLLDEIKDGISEGLGNLWDGVSDFAGGLLEVSPERQAEVDKYYADLDALRRTLPNTLGDLKNHLLTQTKQSDLLKEYLLVLLVRWMKHEQYSQHLNT